MGISFSTVMIFYQINFLVKIIIGYERHNPIRIVKFHLDYAI